MRQYLLAVMVAALLVPVTGLWAQDKGNLKADPEYQMELQARKMKLQRMEDEMQIKREMAKLELEARRADVENMRNDEDDDDDERRPGLVILLLGCLVVHILVAVWIYQDIRQRNCGSGIWIVLGLLAGLMAALVYAVVRLGEGNDAAKKRA